MSDSSSSPLPPDLAVYSFQSRTNSVFISSMRAGGTKLYSVIPSITSSSYSGDRMLENTEWYQATAEPKPACSASWTSLEGESPRLKVFSSSGRAIPQERRARPARAE